MSNDVSTEQDVLITRIFDAPREQVFNAWIDPDEVAAWYGPAHVEGSRARVCASSCTTTDQRRA